MGDEAETEITPTLQLQDPGATYLHSTTDIHSTAHSTSVTDPCPHCDIYCMLSGDMYMELVSLKSFTSAMAILSGNNVEIASRRACGFYTLHETVLLKELSSAPITIKGISSGPQKTRLGQQVANIAQNDLIWNSLKTCLPPTSGCRERL